MINQGTLSSLDDRHDQHIHTSLWPRAELMAPSEQTPYSYNIIIGCFSSGTSTSLTTLEPIGFVFKCTTSGWFNLSSWKRYLAEVIPQALTSAPEAPDAAADTTAELVRALRDESGLTWDQLSKLFGVSRRTLHMWSAGSAMNARHQERLSILLSAVRELPAETPENRKNSLLAPRGSEESLYDQLRREANRSEKISGPAYPFNQALGASFTDSNIRGTDEQT